ncbi:hypothetical protein KCV06_g500, partial [Aureobasidium melanogenum]
MLTFLRIFSPPNRAPNRLSLSASSIMTNAETPPMRFRLGAGVLPDHRDHSGSYLQQSKLPMQVHRQEFDERHEFARFAAVQRTLLVATPIFMHHDYQTLISTRKLYDAFTYYIANDLAWQAFLHDFLQSGQHNSVSRCDDDIRFVGFRALRRSISFTSCLLSNIVDDNTKVCMKRCRELLTENSLDLFIVIFAKVQGSQAVQFPPKGCIFGLLGTEAAQIITFDSFFGLDDLLEETPYLTCAIQIL